MAILEVKSRGGQSSRMNVGLRQICWHNKKHNGLVYYASIMLAYWVDNIKYRSILSNRTVGVSTLVNYRSTFSNRTFTVKLSRGPAPLGLPLESPMGVTTVYNNCRLHICMNSIASQYNRIATFPKFYCQLYTSGCTLDFIRWFNATKSIINSSCLITDIP